MNPQGRIRRSRGAVCGVLLLVLGLWGGLAPFVGPYFHVGLLPDRAWAYNEGRLYYSVIPGAAVALGGLVAIVTRNRGIGVLAGLLAALGGAWFALGQQIATVALKLSVTAGKPIGPGGVAAAAGSVRGFAESTALFAGLGLLAAFLGALAIGRFSLLSAEDVVAADGGAYYGDFPAASSAGFPSAAGQLPDSTTANFPPQA